MFSPSRKKKRCFLLSWPGVPGELGRLMKCPWATGRVEHNTGTISLAKTEHSLPDHRSAGVALWVKPPLEGRQAGSLPN